MTSTTVERRSFARVVKTTTPPSALMAVASEAWLAAVAVVPLLRLTRVTVSEARLQRNTSEVPAAGKGSIWPAARLPARLEKTRKLPSALMWTPEETSVRRRAGRAGRVGDQGGGPQDPVVEEDVAGVVLVPLSGHEVGSVAQEGHVAAVGAQRRLGARAEGGGDRAGPGD